MDLKKYIRSIPDYPKKGILFRDITTLIKDKVAFKESIEQLAKKHYKLEIDLLANFRKHLESPEKEMSNLARDKPRMRMPVNLEKSMLHGFEDYIKTFWNKE